ncbi:MAG: hypothetical protein Q8N99_02070 [Nanoarchaeota archaeon]|nr:hypothetical protein [Nanoarchaeota archaeon]
MLEKNAHQVMEEFRSQIYLDTEANQGCVIENWDCKKGAIEVRYANGTTQRYNALVAPAHLWVIGDLRNWFDNVDYKKMDEDDKKLFKEKLEGLVELFSEE